MKEFLVSSHLGGYYLSNSDEETITERCEQCGDFDEILLSYDDEEVSGLLNALKQYIKESYLLTDEEIRHTLEISKGEDSIVAEDIIRFLPELAEYKFEEIKSFIDVLNEEIIIDGLMHKKLAYLNTISFKKSLKTLNEYKNSSMGKTGFERKRIKK